MNQRDSGLLIVLKAQDDKPTGNPASSSQLLVAALRDQIQMENEGRSLSPWIDRWKATLAAQRRTVTLAIVLVLIMSSLMFGIGSALQIDQAERPGFSYLERIGTLFVAGESADPGAGQDSASKSANTLAAYGASFGWSDRFNSVEVLRETASSKVLWPLSTIVSMLILSTLLLPRSKAMPQKSSAD